MYYLSRYSGTPYEIGLAIGRELGNAYLETQDELLEAFGPVDGSRRAALMAAAAQWLSRLSPHYRDEFLGVASALGCPAERLVLSYVADDGPGGCTSFISLIDGRPWIGRNNDFVPAGRWNHVTVRDIPGRQSTMLFGLPGDAFSGTGINREGLWLHYNWLPPLDPPGGRKPALEPFVFLREALETCRSLDDIEQLLSQVDRLGGMALFAVCGPTGECALFECSCSRHAATKDFETSVAAANHYCRLEGNRLEDAPVHSRLRQGRAESLLERTPGSSLPHDFMAILADPAIEQTGPDSGTVYSLVADLCSKEIWFAADAVPSASRGTWDRVEWPW